MNTDVWETRQKRWRKSQYVPPTPETVDEASPAAVKARKANRVEQLKADIKRYKEYISAAETELKEWASV